MYVGVGARQANVSRLTAWRREKDLGRQRLLRANKGIHEDSHKSQDMTNLRVKIKQNENEDKKRKNRTKEALIKPAFLRAESDHGVSPAGFLSVAEKDAE
jgi:hypothetical protein